LRCELCAQAVSGAKVVDGRHVFRRGGGRWRQLASTKPV
jgi:hypothetical protein